MPLNRTEADKSESSDAATAATRTKTTQLSPNCIESEQTAVADWESEGGHFPTLPSVTMAPANVSLRVAEGLEASDALVAMRTKFEADFATGLWESITTPSSIDRGCCAK